LRRLAVVKEALDRMEGLTRIKHHEDVVESILADGLDDAGDAEVMSLVFDVRGYLVRLVVRANSLSPCR
jgi:hypothetical protein